MLRPDPLYSFGFSSFNLKSKKEIWDNVTKKFVKT